VRVILGVAAALLFWPKIVLLGVVLPGVMLHATGALILGGVFLIQRKRLAVEGEPAPAVLETA